VGRLKNSDGVIQRDSLRLDGNRRGMRELIVPDPEAQIEIQDPVIFLDPPF
jgi:hypothetical protein